MRYRFDRMEPISCSATSRRYPTMVGMGLRADDSASLAYAFAEQEARPRASVPVRTV